MATELLEKTTTTRFSINQPEKKVQCAPYFEHPERVAALVREAGGTPEMIAAAYLHDVVEDVRKCHESIKAQTGLEF